MEKKEYPLVIIGGGPGGLTAAIYAMRGGLTCLGIGKAGAGEAGRSRALIVATGCSPNKLGIPGEDKFYGRGVSYCATCDGAFFKGAEVAVIGGGDAAVQEALMLAKMTRNVHIIHRRGQLRAIQALQDAIHKAG